MSSSSEKYGDGKTFKKIDPTKFCLSCHRSVTFKSLIQLACEKCGMRACVNCIQRKKFESDCEDHIV